MTFSTRFNGISARRLAALAGAVAVLAIGVQALARTEHGDDAKLQNSKLQDLKQQDLKLQGTLDQPLAKAVRNQGGQGVGGQWRQEGSSSSVQMSQSSGGNTYTLRIENGKRTAEVNGKEVPESRIREKNGSTEILDEKGEVLATFGTVVVSGPRALSLHLGDDQALQGLDAETAAKMHAELQALHEKFRLNPDQGQAFAFATTNPPPVMLGINMDSDSEHPGVVLNEVKPGLPADKAGLKVSDRIVSIGDHAVENAGDVRKALDQYKPGEKAVITFFRGGEKQTTTLEFAAFDREKLGLGQTVQVAPGVFNRFPTRDEAWFADAQRRLEKALEDIKNSEKYDQVKKIAEESLVKAKKALEEAQSKVAADWSRFLIDGQNRLADPEGGRIFIERPVAPRPPAAPGEGTEVADERLTRKIERLTEILERLDKRMDEIERRIDKK